MKNKINILLLEDSETDANLLLRFLEKENLDFSYSHVIKKQEFIDAVNSHSFDLILADQNLPGFSGMEAFDFLKKQEQNIPFILITGSLAENQLVEFSKKGIDDYILKGNLLRLPSAIEHVVSKKKIELLNDKLIETNKKLINAYTRIKSSINYAKFIQDSILPDPSDLDTYFPQSFILFKPKEVLSGDFYWFEKVDTIFFIAVADCTGHGIPGALLGMIGNSLLNEAVFVKKLSQPGDILNRLCKRVRNLLKYRADSLYEGMDIVLCSIDFEKKQLLYAGANRPLFIVSDGILIETSPNRISIGDIDSEEVDFVTHAVALRPGNRVFLFTDGLVDQFSEKIDKKITIKRLREQIINSSHLPLLEQKEVITNFFNDWKGKSPQIDDVLLVCFEMP